ncbi:phage head closure protein [uncultured Methanobrevibacter sp.]|uniref:phage head closure protein n=1 Tax=uncultured Methanobrevibacter sp. TaxID=253161 RepID=UPI002611E8BF|nr:phage head closure protein [uncultured Methanobrevibacter sp.]
MPFFQNTTATILKYTPSDDYNEYGEKTGTYEETETIPIDFQPLSPQETLKTYGEILQDTYKIYIDIDVDLQSTDRLLIENKMYTILGTPMKMNHLLKPSHIKVNIQLLRDVSLE